MHIVNVRLVDEPNVALVPRTTPEVFRSLPPTVQDWFILPLVVRTPEREDVLRPNHECGPVAAGGFKSCFQRVQLRRRHADINCSFVELQKVMASVSEKTPEPDSQRS